ncbi:O-antigen ligase domain-containing protein [Candidatus Parcubacteria bacterium]|jgi:O-antigen ligase|nr:MAG: O-antigen ligase domain-containing protein [Candidatus Parcubacteria bacterium]
MTKPEKWLNWALAAYAFLLPWQTRLLVDFSSLGGKISEYASFSIYATDFLLLGIFLASLLAPGVYTVGNKKLGFGMLAFYIVVLGSMLSANRVEVSIFSLRNLLLIGMLYLLIQQKWARREFLLAGFLAGGAGQALFAIAQFIFQTSPAMSWLGLASHDPAQAGTSVVEAGGMRWLRAYGSLPHPNILGGYLAVSLFIAFGFYLKLYEKVRAGFGVWTRENLKRHIEGRQWYFKMSWQIAILVLTSMLLSLGLFLSFSRSAWLGFSIAWLAIMAVLIFKRIPWGWALWLKWSGFILAVLVLVFAVLPQTFLTRSSTQSRLENQSVTTRQGLYQDAWALLKQAPFRGVGYGNMVAAVYDQLDSNRETVHDYQPVHNIYILSAVELGIIGGLVFVIFLILVLQKAFQNLLKVFTPEKTALFGMLVCLLAIGFFDHYFWTLSAGVSLLWFCIAIISNDVSERQ